MSIRLRKKQIVSRLLIVGSIVALIFTAVFPLSTLAATLGFSPTSKSVHLGQNISIDAIVSSTDKAINVVSGKVTFDASYLRAVGVSKSGSIVKFWIQEPTASSTQSTLTFEGVILNPGYTGSRGQIATITFAPIKEGETTLSVTDGAVLANDGVGTNVFTGFKTATVTILPQQAEKPTEEVPIVPGTDTQPSVPMTPIENPTENAPPIPFEITSYPEHAAPEAPFVVDGRGGNEPIVVYAVRADLGGPLSGTILYKNLTEGGYDFRSEATVSNHTFKADFSGLSAGRYAIYARDAKGDVTKLIFIEISSSFWQILDIFYVAWWWIFIALVAITALVYWLIKLRKNRKNVSMVDY